jgi:hypothetical protein
VKYLNELKNMKKTYICPEMDVIELKNQQQLLAGSTPALGGDLGAEDPILSPEFNEFGEFGLIGF